MEMEMKIELNEKVRRVMIEFHFELNLKANTIAFEAITMHSHCIVMDSEMKSDGIRASK